jgi:hypothetical protein
MIGRLLLWALLEAAFCCGTFYLALLSFGLGDHLMWLVFTILATAMLFAALNDIKEIKHAVR